LTAVMIARGMVKAMVRPLSSALPYRALRGR